MLNEPTVFCGICSEHTLKHNRKPIDNFVKRAYLRYFKARADPGGVVFWRSPPPLKPTKVTWFTMILYNSENSIRDKRPLCRPLFCHGSVVTYISFLYSSAPVLRIDYQILLKSNPPLTYWLDSPLLQSDTESGQGKFWAHNILSKQCVEHLRQWIKTVGIFTQEEFHDLTRDLNLSKPGSQTQIASRI